MELEPFNPDQENEADEITSTNNVRSTQTETTEREHGREQGTTIVPSHQAITTEARKDTLPVNTGGTRNHTPIILSGLEQGSNEWHDARRGCITMSNAAALLAGGEGKTRTSYLMAVASEIITGVTADTYKSWLMERGQILEPFAREAYKIITGCEVRQIGLGYLDENRNISASPDAHGEDRGLEIKCQLPKNHLNTLINGVNPAQFDAQMQGCMWIFKKDRWDYVSFCPEFKDNPIFIYTVHRDEEKIKRILESAHKGVEEIKEIVKKADRFPNPDITKICENALETIETFKNMEPEIY